LPEFGLGERHGLIDDALRGIRYSNRPHENGYRNSDKPKKVRTQHCPSDADI